MKLKKPEYKLSNIRDSKLLPLIFKKLKKPFFKIFIITLEQWIRMLLQRLEFILGL